jgi:hypothetical protein
MFLEKITDIVADNFFDRRCQFEKNNTPSLQKQEGFVI